MVPPTFLHRSRDVIVQLINLIYAPGIVKDTYLVGILDIIIDILNVLIEYTLVILPH